MRSMKQAIVAIAAGGLLVAGGTIAGIVLTQGTSLADNASFCLANLGSGGECQVDDVSIPDPSDIYAQLATPSGTKGLNVQLSWTLSCPSTATAQTGGTGASVPSVVYLAQGVDISSTASCTATVTLRVVNFSASTQNVTLELNYDEGTGTGTSASPTPSPTSSVPSGGVSGAIKGYDGKCVDDKGNSSSSRATVDSWSCNGGKSQDWRYASGELIHNNLCANDKGNAGAGGDVILYQCNGSPDEIWIFNSLKDIYTLKAHNFDYCLTIPGASKKNGVQLQVDTCKNSSDQHWKLP
jgi:hypothetical protein